ASAKAPVAALVTEDSNVQNVLETYRARYEGDPKGKEAPALLAAMGNLYRQKEGNYREAAQCFERLISEHPDSPGIRDAYLQLVTCYERLGDEENRRRILRKMVELYPSESQENAYASSLLYR
ncbi:MAG: tetratricopeptide repeat protein, partial [Candidatus Hydrogenedentales bacterium]